MALTAGAAVFEYATEVTAISDSSVILNAAFNAGAITAVTPADKTPLADAVLDITLAVAPVSGRSIHLYRRDLNISGANDATVPDANFKSIYVGSFPLDLVTTQQFISLPDIPLGQDQAFYIENDSGQSTSGTTVLVIKPKTYNGKV